MEKKYKQIWSLEQLGFRKIIFCTIVINLMDLSYIAIPSSHKWKIALVLDSWEDNICLLFLIYRLYGFQKFWREMLFYHQLKICKSKLISDINLEWSSLLDVQKDILIIWILRLMTHYLKIWVLDNLGRRTYIKIFLCL